MEIVIEKQKGFFFWRGETDKCGTFGITSPDLESMKQRIRDKFNDGSSLTFRIQEL